jgi:hypothetical protein
LSVGYLKLKKIVPIAVLLQDLLINDWNLHYFFKIICQQFQC